MNFHGEGEGGKAIAPLDPSRHPFQNIVTFDIFYENWALCFIVFAFQSQQVTSGNA